MTLTPTQLIIIGLAVFLVVVIFVAWTFFKKFFKSTNKNLNLDVIMIQIPKYENKEEDQLSKEYIEDVLGKVESLFSSMAGLKAESKIFGMRTDVFSMEIVAIDQVIKFYVAVPRKSKTFFIQQLQSVYPKLNYEDIDDYNLFQPYSHVVAGALRFNSDYSLPIKTYRTFENDPLESVTNTLSKLEPGESAAVQYVFRSAPRKWHDRGKKIAQEMHKGSSWNDARKKVGGGNFLDKLSNFFSFFGSFVSTTNKDEPAKVEEKRQLSSMEQEMAKGLEEKTAKSGLDANIRIVVSAKDKARADMILTDILNSYAQYNIYEFGNSFKAVIPKNPDSLVHDFIYRHYLDSYHLLLNSEEIVSVVHLPLATTGTPNIDWLAAVKSPPPSNIPKEGLILGKNLYRGEETFVRIKNADRRRHMYEIGQTGTGKSVFLESLIMQDIEAGRGVCVVDPHGDLVEKALSHVPKERAEDVIIFDPSDFERPLAMNMLEYDTEEQKSFAINEMIAILDKLYDLKATGGPMFEQYMRNAMLLIMDDKDSGATLLEIPKVLADEEYRKFKLSKVKNKFVKDFWEKEAQKAGGDASLANMVPYITSKLTPFITNDTMRPIIAQQKSAFNFRTAMDEGKIILLNLSKGKIGETNSSLLGMIVIGKLLQAAMARVDTPEDERRDFYLYIDEFQNYTTDSISIILSEARKYRLSLVLAHQFIAQLTEGGDTAIRDAIFGNVGTIISYRIGVDDAETIAKQMAPVVSEYDLLNMPKYTCYIKLLIDNQNPPAFNFQPILPEKGNYEMVKTLKELSRLKYGRDRNLVEQEISKRVIVS